MIIISLSVLYSRPMTYREHLFRKVGIYRAHSGAESGRRDDKIVFIVFHYVLSIDFIVIFTTLSLFLRPLYGK
jgi:hypothetical protein